MQASINSASGYLYLDSWVLATVVHLATIDFCRRFLNNANDPGGRQYAQMTQAARSCPANIAEGSSRRDTSVETSMRLTDVARATISELSYDYMSMLLSDGKAPWKTSDPRWQTVHGIRLPQPAYSANLMHDVGEHILAVKRLFDPWVSSPDKEVASNAMIILCGRIHKMIRSQLARALDDFSRQGGFAEQLTQTRLHARNASARAQGSPRCPDCGGEMHTSYVKRGVRQGAQFWSCNNYPNCRGTRPL